ncbi:MAG: hypothetical protein EPO68_02915 [Planctomycetota bacterium]|nr:MAG: hypothetical protein EPO68_02915 [Planctomycetota bacterium]
MTQSTPAPASDGRQGLADSDDLFAFDEVVAAASATPRTPIDTDALIEAFDDQRAASATAQPNAVPANTNTNTNTSTPAPAPAAAPSAPEHAAPLAAALPASQAPLFSRRAWTIAVGVIAVVVLLNISLVWIALRNSSHAEQRMTELSASVLELARRAEPPAVAAPQPVVHAPVAPVAVPERPEVERAPALPDYDPDPRREREFAAIEALLERRLHAEARRQVYALLARCDALTGATRGAVEARATYLLARALHGEGAALPAQVPEPDAAPAEAAR